jgi:hypothetical protein
VQRFVARLYKAGYLRKLGTVKRGHPGEHQGYILVRDVGPVMPVLLQGRHQKREREREKETEEKSAGTGEEITHDQA